MQIALHLAAFLAMLLGVAHSVLGERLLLKRLLRRPEDLPKLFGGTDFTASLLRFAWHVTSITWAGLGGVLLVMAHPPVSTAALGMVVGATFLVQFLLTLVASRGKHFAWVFFLAIGVLTLYATL